MTANIINAINIPLEGSPNEATFSFIGIDSAGKFRRVLGEDLPGGGSGGAAWGSITGTLSNQTDLQAILDAKAGTDADLGDFTNTPGFITSSGAPVQSVAGKSGVVTLAAGDILSGTFADGLISESSVTQHEDALSITESQISDLDKYDSADFDTDFATKDTGDLAEGSNLYYTQGRFDTAFGNKSTSDLSEGTNLYYTQGRFDTAFAAKDTDDLSEGSSNLYFTIPRFDLGFASKDTDDLAVGTTNLYYTEGLFDTSFSGKDTGDLTEGSNLYYTQGRFDTAFAAKDTDDLSEGSSNLYFTEERAQDAVGGIFTDSSTINFTYNDGANTVTAATIDGAIDHDSLLNFVADEHIDWKSTSENLNTSGRVTSASLVVGTSPNLAAINTGGRLGFSGSGGYDVAIDGFAFVVSGFPSTGLQFALTGGIRYAFKELTGTDIFAGNVSSGSSLWWARDGFATNGITPTTLAANQNNYSIEPVTGGGGVVRLSASTNVNITGFAAPGVGSSFRGKFVRVYNVGASNTITIGHQNTSSTAANRVISVTGANIAVGPGEGVDLWYDVTSSRYRAHKL